jgi:glycerol dehydrogenase
MNQKTASKTLTKAETLPLLIGPSQVFRGYNCLHTSGSAIAKLGKHPLVIGGNHSLKLTKPLLVSWSEKYELTVKSETYLPDCSENSVKKLENAVKSQEVDLIIGVGGGKSLDTSKLIAARCNLPVVTIPTSGSTCAAWTALANLYSDEGAFQNDVSLPKSPDLLILDYSLIATAPKNTLIAGIGDAIAKWYEASVSSANSQASLTIAAVQQARILRDILLQKSISAVSHIGSEDWKEVIDATVLLAGIIGSLGGANCRTVAAHAVHNALTHLRETHPKLHGEKVAYGILVQLRLEEMFGNNQLAFTARQQLIKFYQEIGLPCSLEDLGLKEISFAKLRLCSEIACQEQSDLHRLPFPVNPEQLLAAMVSTLAGIKSHDSGVTNDN